MTLIPCVKAKPWVRSDWLVSSSKLQPCLELYRFIQTLLKTKVAGWNMHFLLKFCKKTHVQHSSGLTTSLRLLRLESRGYNKLHPSPKLTASLRLMIRSPSSFVLNLCLTFLNSACTLFTPNQMYPLGL
jgi:hypothetical protein